MGSVFKLSLSKIVYLLRICIARVWVCVVSRASMKFVYFWGVP
jgi:ribosome biogenesis protein Nip4